jgi:hypothetical protein
MPKFIGVDETVLRILQIGASDPISLTLEVANQMVTDKSPSSRDEYLPRSAIGSTSYVHSVEHLTN